MSIGERLWFAWFGLLAAWNLGHFYWMHAKGDRKLAALSLGLFVLCAAVVAFVLVEAS